MNATITVVQPGFLAIPGDFGSRHSMYVGWDEYHNEIRVRVYEHGSPRFTLKGKITETRLWCDDVDGPQLTVRDGTLAITDVERARLHQLLADLGVIK